MVLFSCKGEGEKDAGLGEGGGRKKISGWVCPLHLLVRWKFYIGRVVCDLNWTGSRAFVVAACI